MGTMVRQQGRVHGGSAVPAGSGCTGPPAAAGDAGWQAADGTPMKSGDQVRVRGENQDGERVWMAFPYLLVGVRTSSDGSEKRFIVTQAGGENHKQVAPKDIKPFKWGDR